MCHSHSLDVLGCRRPRYPAAMDAAAQRQCSALAQPANFARPRVVPRRSVQGAPFVLRALFLRSPVPVGGEPLCRGAFRCPYFFPWLFTRTLVLCRLLKPQLLSQRSIWVFDVSTGIVREGSRLPISDKQLVTLDAAFAALTCRYCPEGSSSPIACPAGAFGAASGLGTSVCSGQCPIGYFCPLGSTAPLPCPAGVFGAVTGLQTATCSGPCRFVVPWWGAYVVVQ